MQLLVKWYVARNAPGPQDLTENQEWNLFLIIFFTFFGYDVNKLHKNLISDLDYASEHYSPIMVSKKQKTANDGSADDWSYLMTSNITKQAKVFLFDGIGLQKCKEEEKHDLFAVMEAETVKTMNIYSAFNIHLPHILFAFHLLYEEIKLSCNMAGSLFLLAKLLYQLSMDLNLHLYKQHYFCDFPALNGIKPEFSVNVSGLNNISTPNFITSSAPNVFQTLCDLLTSSKLHSYPHLSQVNPMSKNLLQTFALFNKQQCIQILEIDQFFRIIDNGAEIDKFAIQDDEKESIQEIIMRCFRKGKDASFLNISRCM